MRTYIDVFKTENSRDRRVSLSSSIYLRRKGFVPVILCRGNDVTVPDIDEHKFLINEEVSYGTFVANMRRKIAKTDAKRSIIFFVKDNILPIFSATMAYIYREYQDEDGFLYITYISEKVQG